MTRSAPPAGRRVARRLGAGDHRRGFRSGLAFAPRSRTMITARICLLMMVGVLAMSSTQEVEAQNPKVNYNEDDVKPYTLPVEKATMRDDLYRWAHMPGRKVFIAHVSASCPVEPNFIAGM